MKYNPIDRARLRKGEPIASFRKAFAAMNTPVNDRQIKFTISTNTVDRDGDQITQEGWQLDNYLRNPVVLLNHKSDELPIARCVGIALENGDLKATVEFVPADYPVVGQLADAVLNLCRGGFLNATSVGFQPIRWKWADDISDGIIFLEQELLEFSVVSTPSNPMALIEPAGWFEAPKNIEVLNTKQDTNALRLRLLRFD